MLVRYYVMLFRYYVMLVRDSNHNQKAHPCSSQEGKEERQLDFILPAHHALGVLNRGGSLNIFDSMNQNNI